VSEPRKPFWLSKAKIAAIITGILAAYSAVAGIFHYPAVPDWAYAALGGLGLYGVRTAIEDNKAAIDTALPTGKTE